MAYSTSNWFNNAVQGIPGVGADIDIFQTSTTPKYAIGQRWTRSDGNSYVYSHFATAGISSGGLVVGTDLSESGCTHVSSKIYASGSVTAISGETLKPGQKDSHYVQVIGKGVLVDTYAGGYLQISEGDGFGYQYRIRGNTAATQLTSGSAYTYYLELYEPLQQELSTTQKSWMRIIGSRYANLETALVASDMWHAGVTTCSHAASTYGWVQDRGLAGIRVDTSECYIGSLVAVSDTQPGQICGELTKDFATAPKPLIGYCVASGIANSENQIVAVQLTLG